MKYFSTFKQELFEALYSVMEDDNSNTIYGMDRDKYMKLSDEEKQSIESVVSNLEDANKGTDIQSIKDRMDELNKVMMEVSQKMYQTDEPQQQESKPDVEDAEFEEV